MNNLCNFYEKDDYFALRELYLKQIEVYDNKFLFTWFSSNNPLVLLDKKLAQIFKNAKEKFGNDKLNILSIEIHTNNQGINDVPFANIRLKYIIPLHRRIIGRVGALVSFGVIYFESFDLYQGRSGLHYNTECYCILPPETGAYQYMP